MLQTSSGAGRSVLERGNAGSIPVGSVNIAFDVHGHDEKGTVLLVHGLAQQLTGWPLSLVDVLARSGYRVIRIDNRDIGRSSRCAGTPTMPAVFICSRLGLKCKVPYLLDDMARDVAVFIEASGSGRVHLVGASMGGMIGQIVAARYPAAVRTFTAIMSSSGHPKLPGPRADVRQHLLSPPRAPTRKQRVEHEVRTWELIGSPGYPTSRQRLLDKVSEEIDRGEPQAGGAARQYAAILASGSRVGLLRHIVAPTLVVHGDADPLVPIESGRDLAGHVPGARLYEVADMGHDLPDVLMPRLAERLLANFQTSPAMP